jgi:hypothetical protein
MAADVKCGERRIQHLKEMNFSEEGLDRRTIWRILSARMANDIAAKNVEALMEFHQLPQVQLIEAITQGLPTSLARE